MKRILHLLFLPIILLISAQAMAQLNPADPVVTYNPSSPPPAPDYDKITKWVRTSRMSWNTDLYKAYIFQNMAFRIKFPKSYVPGANDGKKYPVMLFFHGVGEAGSVYDNEFHLLWGGERLKNAVENGTYDGYVIYPQSQDGSWNDTYFDRLKTLLDSMAINYKADLDRVSVNGLSHGGLGTWEFTFRYPWMVAGNLPMSAASTVFYSQEYTDKVKFMTNWIFQGGQDANPAPYTTEQLNLAIRNAGGAIKYTLYPNVGHDTWNYAWSEADFFPLMNRVNRLNPRALFDKTGICPGETTTIGIAPGYQAYQWRKDGVDIAGNTNAITVNAQGSYSVRAQTNLGWTGWSPVPVVITAKQPSPKQTITTPALYTNVLPAPNGATGVALSVTAGLQQYEWFRTGSATVLGTSNTLTASAVGGYTVRTRSAEYCEGSYSDTFRIIAANGVNVPAAISGLIVSSTTKSSLTLTWSQNASAPYDEKYFEIYRATTAGGPYTLIAKNNANVLTYADLNLIPGTDYFYVIRPVNDNGAATVSAELKGTTAGDLSAPTIPTNLQMLGAGNTFVLLSWNASTDDAALSSYDVFANGNLVASVNGTTLKTTVTGLSESTYYTFTVKAKDIAGKYSGPSNQVSALTKKAKLTYKYVTGTWSNLPNFTTTAAAGTGKAEKPDLTLVPSNRTQNYGYLWTGYIYIPVSGTYTFETNSDDGSKLYFNKTYTSTATATVSNDGSHAAQWASGTVTVDAGVYPIAVTYFQGSGGANMGVYWSSTALGVTRQEIPGMYYMDLETVAGGNAPAAPSGLAATANGWNKINLTWNDNSNNETGFELFRSTTSGGTYTVVGSVAAGVRAFTDTGLTASTRYYYKVRAVGQYGESAQSSSANAITTAKPAVPTSPNNFLATALSTTVARLTWTDRSSNETGFEIYRSMNTGSNYTLLSTTAANATSFNDSTLAANTIAWYQVRAIGEGGASAFATADSAKALTNPPVIDAINNLSVRYGTTTNVAVVASDADGDAITYTLYNAPAFVTLMNTPGDVHLVVAPLQANMGTYNNVGVIAKDNNNGADTVYFNLVVNDNYAPVIDLGGVTSVDANEGQERSVTFYGTDQNNDALTWSVLQKPSFVTVEHTADSLMLNVNAGYADAGSYTIQFKVTDSNGASDTKSVTLIVADRPTPNYKLFLNFKYQNTAQAPWNNLTGLTTNDLKNDRGETTTAGITFDTYWWATYSEGANTGNNSGVYPDAVMSEFYYFGTLPGVFSSPGTISGKLTGLETNRTYTIKFFSSSKWGAPQPDNGTTSFTVGSTTKSINVQNNTTNQAIFTNLTANASGEIAFTMSVPSNKPGFLNAIEVNAGGADEPPTNRAPELTAIADQSIQEAASKNVALSATDADGDAITYTTLDAPAFVTIAGSQLAIAPQAGNAGTYNNIRVIATDSKGAADTTSFNLTVTSAGVIPGYKFFLNIKYQNTAAAPWNNITGQTTSNLKNDEGETTTAGLTFDTWWWSTYNEGVNTGNNSGVYPDAITSEFLYFGTLPGIFSGPSSINGKLTGLETNRTYTIKFFSSSKWYAPQPDNGTTNFIIGGVTKSVYAHNNSTSQAVFANLSPDANGEIAFTMATAAGTQVGFLNAIEVNVADIGGTPPVNRAPVIADIPNKNATEGSTTNVALSATDADNDAISYTILGAPSFVTITGTQLAIAPQIGNAGTYNNISVIATDAQGAADTTTFNLVVSPIGSSPGYKYLINIKYQNTAPAPWNNATSQTTSNLTNDQGETTTASLVFDTWWWSTYNEGVNTGNNSGVYPDAVTSEFLYFGTLPGVFSGPSSINAKFAGLDKNRVYTIKFFSSSKWYAPQPDNGSTNFTIDGITKSVYADNNSSNQAIFTNLTTNANGEISFNMATAAGTQVGFLNAIEITAGALGGNPPVNRAPVLADITNRNATENTSTNVALSATDADGDAITYSTLGAPSFVTINGSQLTIAPPIGTAGTYNNIRVIATDVEGAADTTSFNLTVDPVGFSPAYKLLVNFKSQNTAPAPWNNATSQNTLNLVNDLGETTTASLRLDTYWWATHNEGVNTGNNSGVYPDAVTSEFFYFGTLPGVFSSPNTINGKFAGLDPNRTYTIKFFGSSKWWAPQPDNGSTSFIINGVTKSLNVHNNSTEQAIFENLTTDANGEINFTLSVPADKPGFVNAIEVDASSIGSNGAQTLAYGRTSESVITTTTSDLNAELKAVSYPNPVTDELSVDIDLPQQTGVLLEFFDMNGRTRFNEMHSNVPAGKNTFRLHTAGYLTGKGIYLLKVSTTTGASKVIKVMKR